MVFFSTSICLFCYQWWFWVLTINTTRRAHTRTAVEDMTEECGSDDSVARLTVQGICTCIYWSYDVTEYLRAVNGTRFSPIKNVSFPSYDGYVYKIGSKAKHIHLYVVTAFCFALFMFWNVEKTFLLANALVSPHLLLGWSFFRPLNLTFWFSILMPKITITHPYLTYLYTYFYICTHIHIHI